MADDFSFLDPSILLGDGSPGQDLTNLGLGPGFFGYPGGDNSGGISGFAPQPLTFGPDNGLTFDTSGFDPSGGSTVLGASLSGGGNDPNAGGSGSGGGSSILSAALHALGIGAGGTGSGLSALLSLLGIGAGAYLNHNASQQGARDISNAVNAANSGARQIFQDQGGLYKPYYDAGVSAINRLAAMPTSNLAANFVPLGTGRGIVPGAPGAAPAGAMTLGQLARG